MGILLFLPLRAKRTGGASSTLTSFLTLTDPKTTTGNFENKIKKKITAFNLYAPGTPVAWFQNADHRQEDATGSIFDWEFSNNHIDTANKSSKIQFIGNKLKITILWYS